MIITSGYKLEINKTHTYETKGLPFIYLNQEIKNYAFLVLREATKEEFLNYIKIEFPDIFDRVRIEQYFYEISTD